MNGTTILLWITIFIIGVIAIIMVKLHYKGAELEKDEESIIPKEAIDGLISYGQEKVSNATNISQPNLSYNIQDSIEDDYDVYLEEDIIDNSYQNIEYESQNQVLINYENEVKNFQEPMNETQIDIMTSNNDQNNEKHELKDLFTIDELIKESKRKDSEREKESQKIQTEAEDTTEIKESIRRKQENGEIEDKLIEEILADEEIGELLNADAEESESVETIQDIIDSAESKEETIQDIIDSTETKDEIEEPKEETIQDIIDSTETKEESVQDVLDVEEEVKDTSSDIAEAIETETETEVPEPATQKDIAEAISTASQEIQEEKEEIGFSESEGITDALLNSEEEIKQPTLKSPTKIDETKDDLGAPIDDSNLLNGQEEENELDYRKDLARITNTIKSSRIFQDVKEKLRPEPEEEIDPIADLEESYIRTVNDYEDEYEPIINETHDEFGEYYEPDYDEAIRQENTRRLFNTAKKSPEPEVAKPVIETIKPKPARENIKIQMGNADMVLKKGDEIIFKYDGDTYSSQVYAINGDDISVRYRRKDITIKPEDVKKIY